MSISQWTMNPWTQRLIPWIYFYSSNTSGKIIRREKNFLCCQKIYVIFSKFTSSAMVSCARSSVNRWPPAHEFPHTQQISGTGSRYSFLLHLFHFHLYSEYGQTRAAQKKRTLERTACTAWRGEQRKLQTHRENVAQGYAAGACSWCGIAECFCKCCRNRVAFEL